MTAPSSPSLAAPPPLASLLERRLVIVTGKGGTGKTTVTAALGVAAAARGRRVLLVEVGRDEQLPALFAPGSNPSGYAGREIHAGVTSLRIDPFAALSEYLALQLGARGYVGPWERAEVLAPRVLQAAHGGLAVPPAPTDELRSALRVVAREVTAVRRLSETDLDVMRWLSRGETAREIAARLNVSEAAVRHRLRRIMVRLEVRNEKELSAVAAIAGLYEPRWPAAA